MEMLESLLRGFNTDIVNSCILVTIAVIFGLGLWYTKQAKQVEFVNYVPTLLTTLGIFGTFLGIVLGLLDFNQNNIEASIPLLLEGLKTAFITSLAGIFSSLIFKTLSTFSFLKPKQVEESSTQATPEAILGAMQAQVAEIKTLRQSMVGNEESTLYGQLKILRGDINDNAKLSLSNARDQANKQQQNFDEFSEKLWLKLQDFADTLSKSATEQVIEALKQVIVDFNNNLTEQFGENFKQLNEAVHKLVEWQENYKLQLEQMQQQYAHGVESISATEASVAHISEQSKVIPESMNDLKTVMEVNQHQLAELERHLEAFKEMRDKAVEAVPQIQQQVQDTVNDISAAVSTASAHYKQLLTESDKYIQAHVNTSNELLEKFADDTENNLSQVRSSIEGAANEFTDATSRTNESLKGNSDYLQSQTEIIKQHLQDAVSDLNSVMRDMIEKMVSDAKEMTSTIKEANHNLASDTALVRDTVITSTEKLQQRLNEVIDEAATQQINQAKRTFDAMEDQVKQQVGFTAEAVDSQLKLIDSAMQQEINRVMSEMGQALAQVSGKFVEDYIKLTQAMNEIVSKRVA